MTSISQLDAYADFISDAIIGEGKTMQNKSRPIDMFLLKCYNAYCHENVVFNEIGNEKSYEDYLAENKSYLISLYKQHRREERNE